MKQWYFELWNEIYECKSKLPSKSVNSISGGSIRDVRKRNLKRIILGHLNINSIRNKFDLLVDQIKGNIDIMVISERKLGESFHNSHSLKFQDMLYLVV